MKTKKSLPKSIWILGFVSLLMDVSSEMIHSLLPLFLVSGLGASVVTVGFIEGIAEATALMVKVFSGAISDYFRNRKWLTVIGYSLGTLSKPLFALATTVNMVFSARVIDRIGKGIRGAPRDALIADLTDESQRGSAYGLRQSLDTLGAFIGPLIAFGLMILWANDFRAIFWVALIPGILAVTLLITGIKEPEKKPITDSESEQKKFTLHWKNLRDLPKSLWWVVAMGFFFSLARFSEAFLLLRSQQMGMELAWVPLVMVLMNLVYSASAFPFGKLADKVNHHGLFILGLLLLIIANTLLAMNQGIVVMLFGVVFWGLHMGMTQGLLAVMVAKEAPQQQRGTCFGIFNFVMGISLFLSSLLAGLIWQQYGSNIMFYAGIFWSFITIILILIRTRFSKRFLND